ncbi:hypothetical protein [Pseudobutyrivibrio ruminis]|uniref:Uncharacterized protein n=1 Tax=Pseudobutyrivibrio ruminis TaxID=46206 RepID=A0A2G3DWX1_9FIRM|nr:hypothetical protein [Pseudobutyrivibrio ruminis]PHU35383.1 hypothetical protein CSX01_05300 [Pseudobutyrivibrio ruminis]
MNGAVSPLMQLLSEVETLKKQIAESEDPVLKESVGSTINAIVAYGQEAYSEMTQILDEFETFQKMEGLTEEQRNSLLAQSLDHFKDQMSDHEKDSFAKSCEDEYKGIWESLDGDSQEFLSTARYLGYALRMRGRGNYAPVINEMCRVFENELKKKIYNDYIVQMTQKQVVDMDSNTEPIKTAVSKKKKNKDYFISDTEMVCFIEALPSVKNNQSGYLSELKKYLQAEKWDIQKLSDSQYTKSAHNYIDNYRNDSAHANLMDEKKAEKCDRQTHKIIKHFIESKK